MRKMCFFTGSEDLCPDDFGYSQEVQCSCDDSILQWQWLCWISRQGNLLVLNWRFIGVLSLSYLFISVPHVISPPSFSLYCWSSLDLRLYFRVHILRRLPFCLFGLNLQNWLQLKKSVSVLFNWCLVNNYYVTSESAGSRRKDYTSLKMMISDHPWTTLLAEVVQHRLQWFGHVESMPADWIRCNTMNERFKGNSSEGRPWLHWVDNISRLLD